MNDCFLQIKVTLSKSAQEKLRRKRKEDKEHNHKEQQEGKALEGKEEFPWERIRLSMSEPEKLTAESEDGGLSEMSIPCSVLLSGNLGWQYWL